MSRAATSRLKVNAPLGSPPTLEWRAVTELGIDPVYQRSATAAASQTLIRRIAMFWDWGLCQPLAVARRPDGSLMVVDGQHRLEAARLRRDIAHLPCVITAYANEGDEAAAFVALNQQRRPLCKIDLFKAALAAEDDRSCAIARVITSAGLSIAPHSNYTVWKPGMLANIGGIESAWSQHGEAVVSAALRALAEGFSGQVLRYAGTILPGIVSVVVEMKTTDEARHADLVRALSSRTQDTWRRAIMTRAAQAGERRQRAAYYVILEAVCEPQVSASPICRTNLGPAEVSWCNQCDQRVSGAKAARCASPFCSLKAKAA